MFWLILLILGCEQPATHWHESGEASYTEGESCVIYVDPNSFADTEELAIWCVEMHFLYILGGELNE